MTRSCRRWSALVSASPVRRVFRGARGPAGPPGQRGEAASLDGLRELKLKWENGHTAVRLYTDDDGGLVAVKNKNDKNVVWLYAADNGGGSVAVRNKNGKNALRLYTDDDGGLVAVKNKNDKNVVWLYAADNGGGLVTVRNKNGKNAVRLYTDDDGGLVTVKNKNDETVVSLVATDDGGGAVSVDGKRVHDYAEILDLATREGIRPGTVVAYDETAAGLVPASTANASRVLGVISGAGGLRPGMVLGSRADGSRDLPVSLSGVVYVRVSVEAGPIGAGDLLVPSSVPGVGMRAIDPVATVGKVFGKALSSWSSAEEGLVRMLVMNR